MADSEVLLTPRAGTGSPPPSCAICLGSYSDKCHTNSCMHQFCFKCLLEWSKIKAECPLCKQSFKSIFHNIKANDDYDEHFVETRIIDDDGQRLFDSTFLFLPTATTPHQHQQYHFRTTFTVDPHAEHAIRQMLLTHPDPPLYLSALTAERYFSRRRRTDGSTSFRRMIYNQNLWVYAPPDITGRYREATPQFFSNNPSARTRLVPWLNRELNALLYDNPQHVMHVVEVIMDYLLRHHIRSNVFRTLLMSYLHSQTDHFIHEFYSFMRSPFDMVGYDRHIIYTERPRSPIPYDIETEYDSDVILVSSTSANQNDSQTTIIDLVDTDSDETIIITEEVNPSSSVNNNNNNNNNSSSITNSNESSSALRAKRHRKYTRSRRMRCRHNQSRTRSRSRSSSTSSSSTQSSSSSSSVSSSSRRLERRARLLKRCKRLPSWLQQRQHKYKRETNEVIEVLTSDSASDDDNIPLSNYVVKLKSNNNSTTTETSSNFMNEGSNTVINQTNNETINEDSSLVAENLCIRKPSPFLTDVEDEQNNVSENNPGPSSGRLINVFKKDEHRDFWYLRPYSYDPNDSSDN